MKLTKNQRRRRKRRRWVTKPLRMHWRVLLRKEYVRG